MGAVGSGIVEWSVEELELRVLNSLPSLDLYLRLFMREKET